MTNFIDPYSDTHPRNIAAEASRMALLSKYNQSQAMKKVEETANRPKKMLGSVDYYFELSSHLLCMNIYFFFLRF